ncbi:MAG TPA: PAS domain-containing sensor histidine kinase [Candidatus Acidoferrales bacterium]|nr:PAS domain-containing sensor histidine kinase [Candidatus Acidoferrales bacterium]
MDQRRDDREQPQAGAAGRSLPLSLLGQAFEAAPEGLLVVDSDAAIVATNSALLRMFGYESADVIGKPVEMLLPSRVRQAHEELRDAYLAAPQRRAMGSGRELRARHASGREFSVEIGLNPVSTPQGAMVLASIVDTSERREMEAAFGRIFESATHGMALIDDDGRIALLNEHLATMLGYAHAALMGQRVEVLLPERHRARHGNLMRSFREAPATRRMGVGRDLTARHASGADLAVEIGLSEVRWQGQQMTLATVVDISVRRHIEMELKQANENLREFTRVASHDLKSPLRGIADLVEWVREDLGENPKPAVVRNLERIAERVAGLERLIADLLRYARSEQVDAECVLIDFPALVRDILRVDPLPGGFSLDVSVDAEPLSAPWTPIETVLRNLIANAVKHHDLASGRIAVDFRDDGWYCLMSVTDDGPGIPEHAKERVFRLFRSPGAAKRTGLGLGLALTKRLVEIHGGRMELVSPLLDQRGSSFRVWWPRTPRRTNNG